MPRMSRIPRMGVMRKSMTREPELEVQERRRVSVDAVHRQRAQRVDAAEGQDVGQVARGVEAVEPRREQRALRDLDVLAQVERRVEGQRRAGRAGRLGAARVGRVAHAERHPAARDRPELQVLGRVADELAAERREVVLGGDEDLARSRVGVDPDRVAVVRARQKADAALEAVVAVERIGPEGAAADELVRVARADDLTGVRVLGDEVVARCRSPECPSAGAWRGPGTSARSPRTTRPTGSGR